MTQAQRRHYLISQLLKERPEYKAIQIPADDTGQKMLLRSLFNVRGPLPAQDDFITIQDKYLREEIREKGITELASIEPIQTDLYLWQGDITTLACDAVVNAANSALLGCFCPCHGCIDNAIHTFSGIQLRQKCAELMQKQGHKEETGTAKITPAYNLPCSYILHTVGPIVGRGLTAQDCRLLASCYRSCLSLAEQNGIKSIAFCCISTGEFHFPAEKAAEIAVKTVNDYKKATNSKIQVIFNVFKDSDYKIYRGLLTGHGKTEK